MENYSFRDGNVNDRWTYFASTSVSKLIGSPTAQFPSVVTARVCGINATVNESVSTSTTVKLIPSIEDTKLDFEAGDETLSRTNLGRLKVGSRVNLERSLAVGDRLGGHYVTGHIDAVGSLIEKRDDPPWSHLRFQIPRQLASQIASKGSIAIDGISLTVVDVDTDSFTVALIPHTLAVTTLGNCAVGDPINLETDVLAKYVQRSLTFPSRNE